MGTLWKEPRPKLKPQIPHQPALCPHTDSLGPRGPLPPDPENGQNLKPNISALTPHERAAHMTSPPKSEFTFSARTYRHGRVSLGLAGVHLGPQPDPLSPYASQLCPRPTPMSLVSSATIYTSRLLLAVSFNLGEAFTFLLSYKNK